MSKLEERTAVVTGAGRGVGRAGAAYPKGECTREGLLPPEAVGELVAVAAALPNTVVFKDAVLLPPHDWHRPACALEEDGR